MVWEQGQLSDLESSFSSPPPSVKHAVVTVPEAGILLIRLNKPQVLNALDDATHWELDALYRWLDDEPTLSCAVVTGTGRAFCAGADLKEWDESNKQGKYVGLPASGFGGLSRREGKKPVVAALNGLAYGGGCEMAINADVVIASETATMALPESRRGVLAAGGSLSRLILSVGRQRAMYMALTGQAISAREARSWGLVNIIVKEGGDVVKKALEVAGMIAGSSPDSIIVTRKGINLAWGDLGAEGATRVLLDEWYPKMNKGENMVEGIKAYSERRQPRWVSSKI